MLIWFIFCGAISDAEMSSFISVLYYLWTNFVIWYLFYIIYRVISYQWVWFKINIGRRNLVSKYYFWASTWRSFSNTRDEGWCCTKLVVISKATVNPRLSASPETPFMPICFFTTNFNRVSQLVQIRMSGDNVLWENFKRMRQQRKKSYEKVWILYGR